MTRSLKAASIREVAARAGVSLGTVSHVLNHPERVRAATRQRVQQAIQELGWVPNDAAWQLRMTQHLLSLTPKEPEPG